MFHKEFVEQLIEVHKERIESDEDYVAWDAALSLDNIKFMPDSNTYLHTVLTIVFWSWILAYIGLMFLWGYALYLLISLF